MSIVPDFEYDIFVSYRHNDNLDGWVTNFVQNLEKELKATLKEPLTIYFDKNPHDGLLETHDVDKSLEGKLKCLIFIPIISQTYCDAKSFAWQHEFCEFNRLSKADQFGRNIRLSTGNVASRILPIRIHELDEEDKSVIENEIRGVLRAIEFIYKESGVNRPLKPDDNKNDNQNKTDYRNQVNKTANAIKELVTSLKNPITQPHPAKSKQQPTNRNKRPIIISVALTLIVIAGYFIYQQQTDNNQPAELDKSIAVLPFVNMSNDPDQEYFSDGISEEILNLLAKVPDLKVIGRTSSFYFKGKNEDLRAIGQKLGAAHLLEGSVRKDGNTIRITAQLIRASDGTHLWSETYDRKMESVFELQDEIANNVLKELKLTLLGKSTRNANESQAVYNLLLKGRYFFNKGDYNESRDFYQKALALDSNQVTIWTSLAQVDAIIGNGNFSQFDKNFKSVRIFADKALSLDNSFSDAHRTMGLVYFFYDFNWDKARQEFKLALKLDPNNSDAYRNLGLLEKALGNKEPAFIALHKSVELNPLNTANISNLADLYSQQGKFDKAVQLLQESAKLNPNALGRQLIFLYIQAQKLDMAQKLLDEVPDTGNEFEKTRIASMIAYDRGKKSEGVSMLKKALADYKGSFTARYGSFNVACAFAYMDQKDDAFLWLATAYKEKFGMTQLKTNLFLSGLHDDERYLELLKKMNLPTDN